MLLTPLTQMSPNKLPTVLFQGKKRSQKTKQSHDQHYQKLRHFEESIYDLIRWDKQEHKDTPVIQSVNMWTLLTATQKFLAQQAKSKKDFIPYTLGVAGPTASGKTTAAKNFLKFILEEAEKLGFTPKQNTPLATEVSSDNFYRNFYEIRKELGTERFLAETNLDTWTQLHFKDFKIAVKQLKKGKKVRIPAYDMTDSSTKPNAESRTPAHFIFTEGLFALLKPMKKLLNLKVYFDVDHKTITERFWRRAEERNIPRNESGEKLLASALEMQQYHVEPTKPHADIVFNSSADLQAINNTLRRLAKILVQTTCMP